MKDIINEFLDYLLLERKYSDHTEVNYELDLYKYANYMSTIKKSYEKIKYADISEYITFLRKGGYSPSSINRNLSALRSFYNFLEIQNKTDNNPFKLIKSLKKEKKLPNYFKYDEFLKMLETLNNDDPLSVRNRLIMELLFATGIRVSELVGIMLNDIDLNSKEIRIVGKGNKERIVFFGNHCKESLEKYLHEDRSKLLKNKSSEYLLINHLGDSLTDRGVRGIIDGIIKKAAVDSKVTPHTFRHTFATMMLNEGCDIRSVQELLGHASLNTTSIYTHLSNEEKRRVYLKSHPRAKDNVNKL